MARKSDPSSRPAPPRGTADPPKRRSGSAAGTATDRDRTDVDDGPLESIGKAVSSPLLGSEEDEAAKERPAGRRGG